MHDLLIRPPRLLAYLHYALIAALCGGCLYLIRIGVFVIAEQQQPWITGDWLINYGSGFVRRGLGGEIIFAVSRATGIMPAVTIAWIQLGLYALIFASLLACLYRKQVGLPMLVLCFSPLTLLFPLLDVAALGRKELIVIAYFGVFVLLVQRARLDRRATAIGLGALAIVATLMHELFFFYVPYFVVAEITLRPTRSSRIPKLSLAIVACSLATLLVVTILGAHIDGDAVCSKLIANGLSPRSCDGAIYWQVRSVWDEIAHTFAVARASSYGVVYGRGFTLALVPVLVVWISVSSLKPRLRVIVAGTACCLLWSVPLFLMAVDWGRFLHIHFMMMLFLLAALLPPMPKEEEAAASIATRAGAIGVYVLVFFFALLSGAFWSVPHCCQKTLGDGVIGLFLVF